MHTTTTRIRAAMYLRQSLDKDGNMLAVKRQREDLVELCTQRGWAVVEYVDDDFGASVRMPGSKRVSKRRPAYDRMVRDILAGKIDAIAAWDADRLYRHPRELEDLIDLADNRGLALATTTGDFDLATPTGRGNARMKGVFARMEMEQKSMRHKRANKQMAETDGRGWWPSRPFGYDADPDPLSGKWWMVRRDPGTKGIIAVNEIRKHPTEAKLVVTAYKDFNAGSTLRSIAARWNDDGVKTPKGNRWTGTAVRALLLSARNAGLREYDGKVVGEGTWPPLVTENVWRQAKRKLSSPERGTNAPRARKYLLSGIARCGRTECGALLGSAISSRGQRQYACNHCQKIARDGEQLDALVTATVVGRLSQPDAVDLLLSDGEEIDVDALREQRRALEDRLAQLGAEFASAPPAFTQAALADIQGKLDTINAQLEDTGKVDIYDGVIGAKDVQKAFERLDLGRQRTIVHALLTVTVLPVGKGTGRVFNSDYIDIDWK